MPPPIYPTYYILTVVLAIFAGVAIFASVASFRERDRRGLAWSVAAALLLAGGAGVAGYEGYVAEHTTHYYYRVDLRPNVTGTESVIVPIPIDETLLVSLHATEGVANWSFVDTVHGRGLYVQFSGATALEALFSEIDPAGGTRNFNPTMAPTLDYNTTVWAFYGGSSGLHVELRIQWWTLHADLAAGWGEYPIVGYPPP